jgi:branched-chain amino acid transport system substrate-binding protein
MRCLKGRLSSLYLLLAIITFILTAASANCYAKNIQAIKLGAILPMTGPAGFLGQQELVGLQLGIEDVNKRLSNKGYKIDLEVQDSASKPANAVTIANKMISVDKVDILFVSTSSANQAVAPIAKQANIPLLVMASEAGLTKGNNNMFRVFMNFDVESQTLAKYISKKNYQNIGIIHANLKAFDSQLELIKQRLPKKITISEIQNYELKDKDFRTQIEKISRRPIDALLILGQGPELFALVSQIRENKHLATVNLIGGFTFLSDSAKVGGVDIYNNLVFSSFPFNSDSAEMSIFKSRKTPDGKTLTDFIDYAYTYDNIILIATALENKKSGETLLNSLSRVRKIKGVTGNIAFDANRDSIIPMKMATYRSGKVVFVDK